MKPCSTMRLAWALAAIALGGSYAVRAADVPLAKAAIVLAVARGNCNAAVKLINLDVRSNDSQTAFVAGRMLDEGLCVKKDGETAAYFFAQAADLGDPAAQLDYAAKVGLGEGTAQDYARAGILCRAAGVDPQRRLPGYALGYACTVRGVAGRLLRETLPAGAFQVTAGAAAQLEFNPGSGQMVIRAVPHVSMGEPAVGSHIGLPVVNAQQEIEKAWHEALVAAPKPDATRLENQVVEVSLDLDMTLERARKSLQRHTREELVPLNPWEIYNPTLHK